MVGKLDEGEAEPGLEVIPQTGALTMHPEGSPISKNHGVAVAHQDHRLGLPVCLEDNAAIANKARMDGMKDFFEGVGTGDTAGIWEGAPNLRPDFRATHQKKLDKAARAAKADEFMMSFQRATTAWAWGCQSKWTPRTPRIRPWL